MPEVLILGAGPAGLGAAFRLTRGDLARVTVVERADAVGGNAGSFDIEGLRVDYGSHRLHPSCDPEILDDLRGLLGDDLLDRPRHGRIRLLGRWIRFPLRPADLVLRLPPSFAARVTADMMRKVVPRAAGGDDSFASILERKLGKTFARGFYLPYARKIWGLPPEELSPIQARRRVSADSAVKLLRKIVSSGGGRFHYPRRGYGQISEALARASIDAGARVVLGATVEEVEIEEGKARRVICSWSGDRHALSADHVWSTVPITVLARAIRPAAPSAVLDAAREISYRSMILVYLVLDRERFTEFDAHYFPEDSTPVSRISEPKNYADAPGPRDRTVLCAELPCSRDDAVWSMGDDELQELLRESLAGAGMPVPEVACAVTRRLPQAYPIYRRGFEERLETIESWVGTFPNLLTFGRQGLFAHDNTHHALLMAYRAAECLHADGRFDRERWRGYRRGFETHVVED